MGEEAGSASREESLGPQIVNIVASINVDCALNLNKLASRADNVEYDPRKFNALRMRVREPKTTALIFPSGRVVVTGAKSEASSRLASSKLVQILKNLGYSANLLAWKVENIVAVAQMALEIDFFAMTYGGVKGGSISYEPELWPGLVLKMKEPHKMTFLIFHSKKVVIMGFNEKKELHQGFQHLQSELIKYKKAAWRAAKS